MSIDTTPAPVSAQQVDGHAKTNGVEGQEGVEQVETGVAAMKLDAQHQQQQEQPQQQNGDAQALGQDVELHRACAGGNVEEVRGVLSRGLESLEVLDMNTGCTPIVLAIRNGHVDVVRELLSAGAIVPPPGLTADPTMLALLYPQSMYPLPPHPSYGRMQPPPEFYPQNGFYPNQHAGVPGQERYSPFGRKESPSNGSLANLPPADVSKTIPCRNFPNCKYGAGCVFFHPPGPAGPGQFYPQGRMSFGGPAGFEGGFQPGFQGQPYFVPNGFQSFPPPPAEGGPASSPVQGENAEQNQQTSDLSVSTEDVSSQAPSAVAPVFVPRHSFASVPPQHIGSPVHSQFGLSPLSPSMLAGSLPSIPPAEAFFAGSPPNMPPYAANGFPDPRRQSFGQQFANGPGGPKYPHGKKPSFSGGPRPFRPPGNLGAWKDGVPPPCAFFVQGKCRNGEFCKFPHVDESGNDVRHPDVIRGLIAPVPSMSRGPGRGRMSGGFGYDPSFRPSQPYAQLNGVTQNGSLEQGIPEGESAVQNDESVTPNSDGAVDAVNDSDDKPVLPASVPQKPVAASGASNTTAPITRSASQPGVQRVHANGFNSRSHSPAPSNVSFHGNGHPRRAGGVRAPYNGTRSSSSGESRAAQRVPGADDFPALGGMGGGSVQTSPRPDAEKKDGKTAAQVLSAPAPVKPVAAEESESSAPASAETDAVDADAQSIKSDASVSMEDESDSDAVIVSHKATPASTPSAASTAAAKKSSVSFAKVISASAAANGTAAPETAPVGIAA